MEVIPCQRAAMVRFFDMACMRNSEDWRGICLQLTSAAHTLRRFSIPALREGSLIAGRRFPEYGTS
ncbi:hypothetical protein DU506_14590 [Vreelandella rituensis]|uniref:Uncharacterized protein n=1 Tax=Vreelandella rituensis TaxID=2282306 RepID=A0A368U040_9GAMM|nr:hypothetical protein DU506_14590 [Halomonas rituensis]